MFIRVMGKPQGKGRPRFAKTGHAYTPPKTKDYEEQVKWAWRTQGRGEKLEGPLKVTIIARFLPGKKEKNIEYGTPYVKKPDADNIGKIILDALNGLAYDDDNAVADIQIKKIYAHIEDVVVVIEEIKGEIEHE